MSCPYPISRWADLDLWARFHQMPREVMARLLAQLDRWEQRY